LNFSKAAENLYLTQPVLSRHINDLVVPSHLTYMRPANIIKKELSSSGCQIEINLISKKNNNNPIIDLFVSSFRSFSSLPENENWF